jgi:hypothetical protein
MMEGVNLIKIYCKQISQCIPLYNYYMLITKLLQTKASKIKLVICFFYCIEGLILDYQVFSDIHREKKAVPPPRHFPGVF